jgi:hypothetical protein
MVKAVGVITYEMPGGNIGAKCQNLFSKWLPICGIFSFGEL